MPQSTQYQPVIVRNLKASIETSTALSSPVDIGGTTIAGYIMPSSWTSADITLQGSVNGSDFFNIYDRFGNEVRHVADASRLVLLNPSDFAALRYLKFRSGTSGAPVNQPAQREITIIARAV